MIRMADIEKMEKEIPGLFKISWKMTEACNYHCPYCYMKGAVEKPNMKNRPDQKRVEEIAGYIDRIIDCAQRSTTLHLIGGEICTFDLMPVLMRIKSSRLVRVIFATNFSRPADYWAELVSFLSERSVKAQIIASLHLDMCNPDEFVSKAIQFKDNCFVKCVLSKSNIDRYRPLFKRLSDAGVRIQITVERDDINACEHLSDEDNRYVHYINSLNLQSLRHAYYVVTLADGSVKRYNSNIELINDIDIGGLDTNGFYCTAGVDGIRIVPDGTLRRAGCRYAAVTRRELGGGKELRIEDFTELPKEGVICDTSIAGLDGVHKYKMCTCFGNTSMYRHYTK